MNIRSRFDEDFDFAYASITTVTHRLREKIPNEMVALVLLRQVRDLMGDFADFDQWELVKPYLVDMRDDFETNVEPHLSSLLDTDLDQENYNGRYA